VRVLPKAAKTAKPYQSPAAKPPAMYKHKTFPAPVRGWVLSENLATVGPASARVLDNWFPTTTGVRIRGGGFKHATLGAIVRSMWTYKSGGTEELFAATADSIFDITAPADRDVAPTADVTGQTSGYYSAQQFGTAGGDYLYLCNGDDDPLLYDGTTFTAIDGASTPAITGVTTSGLSQVWSYASRLFFVEKDTLNAWYLPVDSIGGAASSFSLAGIVKRGGSLVFGGRWSLDAGDGLDDKCVFVTDEGEVAVYSGTNPGSASTWQLDNLYRIGKPLGKNCTMQAGGDMLIATENGLVPLSAAIRQGKDFAALDMDAVSAPISPEWETSVGARRALPWEVLKIPEKNMLVVSQPRQTSDLDAQCFAANLETGAWCRFTGWDVRCTALFGDRGYYGANDGFVYLMESGGSDNGTPYTAAYAGNPDHLESPGATKTFHQARALFLASSPFTPKISAGVDYQTDFPAAPNSEADYTEDVWDVGLWDVASWDSGGTPGTSTTRMVSIGRTGETILPQIQVTMGVTPSPTLELISYLVTYTDGEVVT